MKYEEMIQKIAGEIVTEVVDKKPRMNIVEKTAAQILRSIEKEAEEEENELSEKTLDALGLSGIVLEDEQDAEEEGEESEESAEDQDDVAEETPEEAAKTAREYLIGAFMLEKEAMQALAEAELMKRASLTVFHNLGIMREKDIQKIASMDCDKFLDSVE